jgi:predicted membrane metal-binding protein
MTGRYGRCRSRIRLRRRLGVAFTCCPGCRRLPRSASSRVGLGLAAWRWRLLRLPFWLLLGAFWAHWNACLLLCSPFPDDLARAPLVVEGRIASIPTDSGLPGDSCSRWSAPGTRASLIPFTGLVRLSWYDDAPPLRAGEQWRLPVRLKPRHGLANPGTFDFERWLFEQGVKATGNLRRGEPPSGSMRVPAAIGSTVGGRACPSISPGSWTARRPCRWYRPW